MNAPGTLLPLAVVGCDFRLASSRLRSRLVLDEDAQRRIAGQLAQSNAAEGFVDLTTCNRNEWIVSSEQPEWAAQLMRTLMLERLGPLPGLNVEPYVHVGEEAARHLFRVATGRESLVVGERQIAGQFFRAIELAQERDTSSRILNGLSPIAGRLVRSANRCGCLASSNRGVHSLAVAFVRQWQGERQRLSVAVLGLGEIGRRVRGLLEQDSAFEVVPCNRTLPENGDSVRPLSELEAVLGDVDAAILCTGAPEPILRCEHLVAERSGRGLLIVDIGIPEQSQRELGGAGIERAGLDELTALVSQDEVRQRGNAEADRLIERATDQFRRFCHEPDIVEILEAVREQNQHMADSRIPQFIESRFAHLSEPERGRLERELRHMLQNYTHELFGSIRKAAERRIERAENGHGCACEERN